MRRRVPYVIALLVALAAFATPAAADPGVPPEVLAPADGATTPAGEPVTFRVRSHAGDGYLWVLFSNSPAIVDPCGKIGQDNSLSRLEPTAADPTIYEATPKVYETYTFWLNRPGPHYWQAYRIEYGGGADGCTEAAPRVLNVVGQRQVEIGPQPTEPADGATFLTGPLKFGATTGIPSDDKLWIHVSRSSARTEAGGLLEDDVEIESLTPTAVPGTFAATPKYFTFPTFWMNTPGTYYWQPYRISSFGDPDGFVEGPVRRFVLKKAPPLFGSGGIVVAPTTKRCVSRRLFRIRVRKISGVTYSKVEIRLRGKLVKTVKGTRTTANIDLRGLPKGRWTVEIRVTTTTGRVIKGTRAYRTCTSKQQGTNTSPL